MPAPPSPLEKVGTFIASITERISTAFSPEKMAPVAEDVAAPEDVKVEGAPAPAVP